jgi:hypothetical protein
VPRAQREVAVGGLLCGAVQEMEGLWLSGVALRGEASIRLKLH